jgi:hypothetical protein
MKMPWIARCSPLAVLLLAAGAAAGAAQELPEGRAVIARYQEAVGGRNVLDSYQTMHVVGDLSVPAQGLSAAFEAFGARPNRTATRVAIAGFGEMRSGFTGEVAWSLNPMEGPRIMEGREHAQTAEEAAFESNLRTDELIESATTVERTKLGGRDCLKVKLVWKSGRETHDCYSEETGLLTGSLAQQESSMGSLDTVTLYDDYRDFGGMLMPARVTLQIMGMEQIITISEIRFDAVDDAAFDPPAEIKALIGG